MRNYSAAQIPADTSHFALDLDRHAQVDLWFHFKQRLRSRAMLIKGIIVAAALFAPASAAIASPDDLAHGVKQLHPLATPRPKLVPVDCRFWQCNCHNECIGWDEQGRCNHTYRTCDTCSSCND
jgi:hypothetical protein